MEGLSAGEIENCTFSLLCTKTWNELKAIDGERRVRFCNDCRELVHLCTTAAEVKRHSRERHCVAIKRDRGPMLLGDVAGYDG